MSRKNRRQKAQTRRPSTLPSAAISPPTSDRLGWTWILAMGGLALAVRLAVAAQLSDTVLFRWPQLDSLEYVQWAQQILAGPFPWPVPPPHGLGYPVFLAALLSASGGGFGLVRLVQAAIGAGSCVLTAAVGGRAFGLQAGRAAGWLLAVYGPLVFVDVSLLGEGFLVALLLLSFWLAGGLGRPLLRGSAAGAVLGLAVLVRPTALALLPALILALLQRSPRERRSWAAVGLLGLALLAVTAPVVIKISRVNGAFVPVQGFGGFNFYLGNSPDGDGLPSSRLGSGWEARQNEAARAGVSGAAAQDRYYFDKTLRQIRQRPWRYLGLLASKAFWLTQAEEVRDSHSLYFFRSASRLLAVLPGFGLVFPFALCGLGLAAVRRPLPLALFAWAAAFAAVTVLTVVGLRYRLPLIPALAVFAGLALVRLWAAWKERRWREAGLLAAVTLVGWGAAHARTHPPSHNFAEEWTLSGMSLEHQDDLAGALDLYQRALAADRGSVTAWEGIGRLRIKQGDFAGAEEALRTALRLDPQAQLAHYELAVVLLRTLRSDEAVRELRASLALSPEDLPTLHTLGDALFLRGDLDGAEAVFTRLARTHPGYAPADEALARIAQARNRPQ